MIKKIIPIFASIMLLASCKGDNAPTTLKIVSPKGAPSVSMYDQGNNVDWTSEAPASLPAELQGYEYDVVIFDSITGLASIKKNNLDFALAKVITGGNFHLIGINTSEAPTSGSKIISFQQDKAPDKVMKKVLGEAKGLTNLEIKYVTGDVSATAAVLKTGKFGAEPVQYVLSAEPVITQAKSQLDEGVTLTEIYNMREEWKAFSGQDAIVQAGVFVRKSSISQKKDLLSDFRVKLDERLDSLCLSGENAANAMHEYSDNLQTQANRFGANENLVRALQKEGKNRLGFVSTSETVDVNAFLTSLGEATYSSDYFVNI